MSNNDIITNESKSMGAFLAAAYGDALGWPNERIGKNGTVNVSKELIKWERKSGGRYYPYTETINAGSYSDDTQLILSLCRAYQYDEKWWNCWTEVELPLWTIYERGGGGATKRAAKSWMDGRSPWSRKEKEIKSYFNAGGNGVAMRVLPHVLVNHHLTYEKIAQNIFLDGIATHGHPEALTGALAYGYSLWKSFGKNEPLGYGQLIDEMLKNCHEWESFPERFKVIEHFDEWYSSAKSIFENYDWEWDKTVKKLKTYMALSKEELSNASLADDEQLLKKMGCFDRSVSGAGTVAAASSIYLASRYASSPINGVVTAAFSIGSDTDTIASMTGGLLGILCGHNWIFPQKDAIQDGEYLADISQKILSKEKREKNITPITSSKISRWLSSLLKMDGKQEEALPDGRKAFVNALPDIEGKTGKFKVTRRILQCEDGQSLYISKINLQKKYNFFNGLKTKLFVDSLDNSLNFYTKCFDMNIEKRNGKIIIFREGLVLSSSQEKKNSEKANTKVALCFQVGDIESVISLVREYGAPVLDDKTKNDESKYFICNDLDGNRIEVSSNGH